MRRLCCTICILAVGFGGLLMGTVSAWGQALTSASITGKVTEASGGALPNVRVTVTSPALQVPRLTTTTDANGDYKLLDLPAPGVYRVSFELTGFETYTQEGVNLSVGFSGRIDAAMKVGSVQQTVVVRGENPVVDTVNTAGTSTLQTEEIQDAPKGVGYKSCSPWRPESACRASQTWATAISQPAAL